MVNNKTKELFLQFSKFVVVGAINTGIDIGVLNLLMLVTGYNQGLYFSVFKAVSFIAAVSNSYLMNKFWTFRQQSQTVHVGTQMSQFFIVSIIGLAINVGVASLVVNVVSRPDFISSTIWANIGTLIATAVSLIWNFIGYKLFVFKKPENLEKVGTN